MKPIKFQVIGDMQETTWIESLFLRREKNLGVSEAIVEKTLSRISEDIPDFVVFLGDLVSGLNTQKKWARFDELTKKIKTLNIPIYSCLGNHDFPRKYFFDRFPSEASNGFHAFEKEGIYFLFLNTCAKEDLWIKQKIWYQNELFFVQNNPHLKKLVIFSHHPPFSNSFGKRRDLRIEEELLPPYYPCKKASLWISGHAHTYERLRVHQKMFIVSGGGGGPRIKVHTSTCANHDMSNIANEVRPFHFLDIQINRNSEGKCRVLPLETDAPIDEFPF